MNRKITYTRRIVIKDKPLYRTIAEWTIAGALVGAGIMFAYKSQSDFKENVVNHSQQNKSSGSISYSSDDKTADTYTNETSNISGNKLERVLE